MTPTLGLAPVREQLANGITLIVKQTPTQPAVTISAAMSTGSLCDPLGGEGTAHLLARVLDRGAGTRTGDEVADVLDLHGVSPSITVSRHTTTVTCDCLAEADLRLIEPAPQLTGIKAPSYLMSYDYTLFSAKDVDQDLVYQVAKLMYENLDDLRATGALWAEFQGEMMAKDVGLEYHPGAIRFYKEAGLWKRN